MEKNSNLTNVTIILQLHYSLQYRIDFFQKKDKIKEDNIETKICKKNQVLFISLLTKIMINKLEKTKEKNMSTCLGMYIEKNLIKYAKVEKERENIKIESYGIKFYENLGDAIKQIIAETYSFKTPVSINLSEEMYNYFYMFNMLSKTDLTRSIETEFESMCYERGQNSKVFESRYVLVQSQEDKQKIKVIHVSENKNVLNKQIEQLTGSKVAAITPLPISLPSIADLSQKENALFVNIEGKTVITAVTDQKIYDVIQLDVGMEDILDRINIKENSYAKAYDICKNTTIYTIEGQELDLTANDYIDDIMPNLYAIVTSLQDYINGSVLKFDKIYLTGLGVVINNIDLYFQEFFKSLNCEILKPFFAANVTKGNLKDIIEVNSATALAVQGLGIGLREMNFKKKNFDDNLPDWLKVVASSMQVSAGGSLDAGEKLMLRCATGLAILVVVYSGFSITVGNQINKKMLEAKDAEGSVVLQLSAMRNDIKQIEDKADKYAVLVENLETTSSEIVSNASTKDAITTLLNQIIEIIPKDVQVTSIKSIENVNEKGEKIEGQKIRIEAQAKTYEQLGYFKIKLETSGAFQYGSVYSTPGANEDKGIKKIVIEGVLP